MTKQLTDKEKSLLFWASFLALMAAGVGFVFRVMIPTMWADSFQITLAQVGALTGAALWPIAITMIVFSLLVDKIGYKVSMLFAFILQAASVVLTIMAKDFNAMWWACFCAGLGHGVVEAVINPLCASIYREEKSKWLNILHASWPAGIVVGGIAYILLVGTADGLQWADTKWIFWFMLAPVVIYGVLFFMCKRFPVDERVEAGVSYREMLKEFGGLGIFVAATFIVYEVFGQAGIDLGSNKLIICIAIGAGIGFVMRPIMGANLAAWAIVLSAGIMMILRFFAGVPLKFMNPPQLLLLSSVFSIIGLFALSVTSGPMIFGAFVLYAIGQTFYWPTVLGFVSEQFPKGGAMTLNTVSAMGLLTVGIFGFPFLGAVQDHYSTSALKDKEPAIVQSVIENETTFTDNTNPAEPKQIPIFEKKNFFGAEYDSINVGEFKKLDVLDEERVKVLDGTLAKTSQSSLKVAAILPAIMAAAFLLIILYYRSKGGYKPVSLKHKGLDEATEL